MRVAVLGRSQMQRSALNSTLRRGSRVSSRCSSTARPAVNTDDVDSVRIRKLSTKIIDTAALGESKGPVGNWSFNYQSRPRYEERMTKTARLGQRLSALRSQVPNWEQLEAEPMDMCQSKLVTPPGTLVEIRRFAFCLLND